MRGKEPREEILRAKRTLELYVQLHLRVEGFVVGAPPGFSFHAAATPLKE